jgi:hypothetical protein
VQERNTLGWGWDSYGNLIHHFPRNDLVAHCGGGVAVDDEPLNRLDRLLQMMNTVDVLCGLCLAAVQRQADHTEALGIELQRTLPGSGSEWVLREYPADLTARVIRTLTSYRDPVTGDPHDYGVEFQITDHARHDMRVWTTMSLPEFLSTWRRADT